MDIEDMFGDLHLIDILAETKTGEVVLGLVCNGFIDGQPETQTALLDKMEGYLNHTKSEEFQKEYPGRPVILRVTFTEKPDQLILDLLHKCQAWSNDFEVALEIEIGGKRFDLPNSVSNFLFIGRTGRDKSKSTAGTGVKHKKQHLFERRKYK